MYKRNRQCIWYGPFYTNNAHQIESIAIFGFSYQRNAATISFSAIHWTLSHWRHHIKYLYDTIFINFSSIWVYGELTKKIPFKIFQLKIVSFRLDRMWLCRYSVWADLRDCLKIPTNLYQSDLISSDLRKHKIHSAISHFQLGRAIVSARNSPHMSWKVSSQRFYVILKWLQRTNAIKCRFLAPNWFYDQKIELASILSHANSEQMNAYNAHQHNHIISEKGSAHIFGLNAADLSNCL